MDLALIIEKVMRIYSFCSTCFPRNYLLGIRIVGIYDSKISKLACPKQIEKSNMILLNGAMVHQ